MENKPSQKPYRFSLILDAEDQSILKKLRREFGTEAQAVRIAIRRLKSELSQ